MDQNQFPSSSPVQSHHSDFPRGGRSANDPSIQTPASSTLTRPSSSHAHAHPQAAVAYTREPMVVKQGDHEEDQWNTSRSDSDGNDWRDSESASPEAGPSTQPLGTSSRLPTPAPLTTACPETCIESGALTAPPRPTIDISGPSSYEAEGSPLLTSEPLNRPPQFYRPGYQPVSFGPEHRVGTAPPILTSQATADASSRKRRNRSASLPTGDPVYKRRRCDGKDGPTTPSDPRVYTYQGPERPQQRYQQQLARANELGKSLQGGRGLGPTVRPGDQVIIASRQPPINVRSLRALDAGEILKNGQLRHDLLFDTLAFRPVNVTTVKDDAGAGEIVTVASGLPGADHYSRTGCTVTDMYWDSVEKEIITGCRCTRWYVEASAKLDGPGIKNKVRLTHCICGGWRPDMEEDQWWRYQKSRMWPSRLPDLVGALREILISLMGSTTPCPNHFAHSFSREALEAHEQSCPTVTHALVPQLYEALDPEFLTRRVRRRSFDPSLFEMLGEAMKVHCAPIRDTMVDDMVQTAIGSAGVKSNIALGLRKCFDCVEVMKLDIANHQVHALRPHLWVSAPQHERATFDSMLISSNVSLPNSITQNWIRAASIRVLHSSGPGERVHLIGQCSCNDNSELVLRAIAQGFMQLVYHHWPEQKKPWPPVSHRRLLAMSALMNEEAVDGLLPESFRMDARRIKGFYAEAIEVANLQLMLMACQNGILSLDPTLSPTQLRAKVLPIATVAEKLVPLVQTPLVAQPDEPSEIAIQLAHQVISACDADTAAAFDPLAVDSLSLATRANRFAQVALRIDAFMAQHIRPDGPLMNTILSQTESVVEVMLSHMLLQSNRPDVPSVGKSSCKYSMTMPLSFGASDSEIEDDSTEEATMPASASTIRRPEGSRTRAALAALRERRESILTAQKEREDTLVRRHGLWPVEKQLIELTARMFKIVGFHAGVFGELYAEKGMIIGSSQNARSG